ncbi:type III secretion protein [Burkholderia pyrrocinia]|uniref:type III secretion protein n=1 Tax=Burkholderia pyrrocinia TaxID=60550 RepID=UPI001589AB64|nr:type III secretion protein [Burkholderia pyrrocinia]
MYEQLETVAAELNDLQGYLDRSMGSNHDDRLCDALDAAAHECLIATAETDLDRQRLASLHHGFLAAKRIVQSLLETGSTARA